MTVTVTGHRGQFTVGAPLLCALERGLTVRAPYASSRFCGCTRNLPPGGQLVAANE